MIKQMLCQGLHAGQKSLKDSFLGYAYALTPNRYKR
jgi:hypothetical protein